MDNQKNDPAPESTPADLCGCGCKRRRAEVVREVARTMLLNDEQADSLVPYARSEGR